MNGSVPGANLHSVCIVGGGVAGIAAAVALADAGLRVELIEKRPLLGGRASSFIDHETGERMDECQHGTMRCCTSVAHLLERLGVHDRIRYFDRLEFLDSQGVRSVIAGSSLPAPLHTAPSFLAFKSLGLKDKLAIGRAMMAILRAGNDPRYQEIDVAAWFREQGQTERAIKRFWRPVLISSLNEELDRISCAHAFMIFRDGFLNNARAFHFGVPTVPLGSLYTEPTLAYLEKRGGCVRTRTIVDRFEVEGSAQGRVSGVVLNNGERIEADYYVSALQFDLLLKALPAEIASIPYFAHLRKIQLAPIMGVHLWFNRRIECPEALAILDRETEWIFNKTRNFGLDENKGTYLSVVISASRRYAGAPKEQILETIVREVRECLPDARNAQLIRSQVIRWPKATLSPLPGVDALRPDQRSPLENFFVAGEWTRTGWPSTMESAARSGYLAAGYVLEAAGLGKRPLPPDLPPGRLARMLGR